VKINIAKNTSVAQQSGKQPKLGVDQTVKHDLNKCITIPATKSQQISDSTAKCVILSSVWAKTKMVNTLHNSQELL